MSIEKGGEIIDKEIWGIKDLSYPIKKSKKGLYMFFQLSLNSKYIEDLNAAEKLLKLKLSQFTKFHNILGKNLIKIAEYVN